MTLCKRCGVKLLDNSDTCILCGSRTEAVDDSVQCDYPHIRYSNRYRHIVRILGLISVVAVLASLYLNYRFQSETIWSLIVFASTGYCWTLFFLRKSYRNPGLLIFILLLVTSVIGFLIDLSTGNHGWMINYVIPFLFIFAQGIIMAVMIARPLLFRDFVLYELEIAVLGIGSILLLLFDVVQVEWPYIAVCIYSAILLVGTFLIADRKIRQELIKRFHI